MSLPKPLGPPEPARPEVSEPRRAPGSCSSREPSRALPLGAPQPHCAVLLPPTPAMEEPSRPRAPSSEHPPGAAEASGKCSQAARARRALGRGGRERPGPHLVRDPGPGPSPTPASSPRRRSRRRRREVKWGWDGGRPASPAPSGRAERGAGPGPEAEGARRHLHRPASARRARASARPRVDPAPSASAGDAAGSRGAREGREPGGSDARGCGDGETRLERSSARFLEATPRPGPAARRGAKSRDCRRRHRRRRRARGERRPRASRDAPPQPEPGAGMPSPPPTPPQPQRASARPARARAPTLLSQAQRPHGGLPGTAGSCLRASGAPGQA
ncbi:basic proline-rich protein-like [Cervus canadensis]|uniref:basic proline-rich protein-like n=1 Tax=Cervus canadensis TaxID=1574408 RepID=UPI001C9E81B7|nr:basic proline-rich protein-like [Cervus canadensis]